MKFLHTLLVSTLLGMILVTLSPVVSADEPQQQKLTAEEAKAKLLASRPELPIMKVVQSPLPDFFEVTLNGGMTLYMNNAAEFLFAGDLFMVGENGLVNATEAARTRARKQMLDGLDESEMVVFSPAEDKVRTTITVFTDIDCGYCRKLHAEVPELNRMGIAVRYLAYPRAGLGSESYDKLVSAWCADNPQVALTRAKRGEKIKPATCENPVAAQLNLGHEFGVTGTPAIIYETGQLQAGYAPAEEMARRLGIN